MKLFEISFFAMGSPCELKLYGDETLSTRHISEKVIADVERLEQRYSRYRDDSLLSDINRAALAGKEIKVDEETGSLLNYAQACFEQSDGLFDITSGILRKAWDFKSGRVPESKEIDQLLDLIG